MRPSAVDHMIFMADEDDTIEFITTMYPPIRIQHKFLAYAFIDYCIRINDNGKKEQYMIQLESLEAIKVIKPKFKGKTWWEDSKVKVGA